MTNLKKATRPTDSKAWGTRGMRNPARGAERYNPGDENLRKGLGSKEGTAESSVNDHGSLSGLGDDDHSQYLTSYRHRGRVTLKSANYTATTGDFLILVDASGGAVTISFPPASTANEVILYIKKIDSSGNAVTVDPDSSETVDGSTTRSISSQYSTMAVICDGSTWHRFSSF